MKIAIIVISILVIAALLVGGCAHRFKEQEKRAEYFAQKITKKLDLTGEQQVRLESLKEEMLALRKEISEKREETRGSVRELLSVERFDQEKALDLVNGHAHRTYLWGYPMNRPYPGPFPGFRRHEAPPHNWRQSLNDP